MINKLNNPFVKNFFLLFSASSTSQLILLLSTPLLSRLYNPIDFGIFSFYVAVITVVASISTLKYELAILIPEENEESIQIYFLGFLLILGFTCLSFLLFPFLFEITYFQSLNTTNLKYLLPLNILFLANYQLITNWFVRNKRFKIISFGRIIQALITVSISLILGLDKNPNGLIFGWFFGQLAYFIILFTKLMKDEHRVFNSIDLTKIFEAFKRYKKFAIYTAPHGILNSFSQHLPAFIIPIYFNKEILGLYSMSARVVQSPLSVLSYSISQVFNKTLAELYQKKSNLFSFLIKIIRTLLLLLIIPIFLIYIFSPDIFSIVFGDEWKESGIFLQYLVLLFFSNFIASVISYIPSFFEKQKKAFFLEIILTSAKLLAFLIGGLLGNIYISLLFLSISGVIIYSYNVYWYMEIVKSKSNYQ